MGRATYGVKGLVLREGDRVVAMEELDPHGQVLTVTERGYGKRTPVEDYRLQGRGGLGIINLKVTPKTGEVVGVSYVTPDEGLMLITQEGMIIRLNVSGVREVGRSAQGVKLMNLDAEDCIVAVAKLAEKDEETEIELAKADGGAGAGRAGARGGRASRTTPTSSRSSTAPISRRARTKTGTKATSRTRRCTEDRPFRHSGRGPIPAPFLFCPVLP